MTELHTLHSELGNSFYRSRSRGWCFTLNNYEESDDCKLAQLFIDTGGIYVIGREIAPTTGTPHLQGYVHWKDAKSGKYVSDFHARVSWRKARGTPEQNKVYCGEDGNYITNFGKTLKEQVLAQEYEMVMWKSWQLDIMIELKKTPHPRQIHWIYETVGNVGKSYLAKYLSATIKGCLNVEGKKADIYHEIAKYIDAGRNLVGPKIILVDIPREAMDYFNYGCIEKIKNGHLLSGKFDGAQLLFPHPHIVCFANELPDISKMSKDRWNILRIVDNNFVREPINF